ncbi:hypothetical protein Goshw_027934 [Gossypium schwendimanii]|uniref:Reverse transcriptase zinc-binding domain-containing protein n=1 Tax=Gossypium schwendimanii TaxID=34291 RepID=A0A7J9MVS5_GOSSC|nr:hypothetical protein [Gossypium schwendimanii]
MEWLRRRIGQNGSCSFCGLSDEDLIHVLRDCLTASEVWRHVVLAELQSMFFTGDLKEWVEMKLCSSIWLPKVDGLILIQEKGHHKVVIYSDNLEVFEVIPEDLPIDLVIDGLVNFRLC